MFVWLDTCAVGGRGPLQITPLTVDLAQKKFISLEDHEFLLLYYSTKDESVRYENYDGAPAPYSE